MNDIQVNFLSIRVYMHPQNVHYLNITKLFNQYNINVNKWLNKKSTVRTVEYFSNTKSQLDHSFFEKGHLYFHKNLFLYALMFLDKNIMFKISDLIFSENGIKSFEYELLDKVSNLESVIKEESEKHENNLDASKELNYKTTNLITESIYNFKRDLQTDLKKYESSVLHMQKKNSELLNWFWLQTILQPIFFNELKSITKNKSDISEQL